MPNRILKESICTSETINALSHAAETFFYRLLVNCDDYGRFDARPSILRSRLYPLRIETVTDDTVTQLLRECTLAGLTETYTSDGRPYLQVVTWETHQQIRAKRSKYPERISDGSGGSNLQSNDSNGNHLIANVPVIQSNPNPNPNPMIAGKPAPALSNSAPETTKQEKPLTVAEKTALEKWQTKRLNDDQREVIQGHEKANGSQRVIDYLKWARVQNLSLGQAINGMAAGMKKTPGAAKNGNGHGPQPAIAYKVESKEQREEMRRLLEENAAKKKAKLAAQAAKETA